MFCILMFVLGPPIQVRWIKAHVTMKGDITSSLIEFAFHETILKRWREKTPMPGLIRISCAI